MALPVLPILKALAPLIAEAGGVVAGLRSTSRSTKAEERVERLERDVLRSGEVLTGLAQQLHAIAQELRRQAEITEAMQRRARLLLIVAASAGVLAVVSLIVVLAR